MPWTAASFRKKHNKRLTLAQARKAARIANAILEETGNEALAIRTANARVKAQKAKHKTKPRVKKTATKVKRKKRAKK